MAGPASAFTDGWEQTGSLVALREAIEQRRPAAARDRPPGRPRREPSWSRWST